MRLPLRRFSIGTNNGNCVADSILVFIAPHFRTYQRLLSLLFLVNDISDTVPGMSCWRRIISPEIEGFFENEQ